MMIACFFLFGTLMGSFLTLVASRLMKEQNWITGRSTCDHCGKPLSPIDLIPIFSYLFSFGKSRCCGKRLSLLYPLSEMIMGISYVIVLTSWYPFHSPVSVIQCVITLSIVSLLWIIFVSDLTEEIIPFDVLGIAGLLGVGLVISGIGGCIPFQYQCFSSLLPHLFSGIIPAFLFFLLWIVSRGKAMGDGDIFLVFLLGFLLGYPGVVVFLYVAFLTGAIVGVILMMRRKKSLKSHIPFGPFLIVGAGVAALWGTSIIHFVTHLWF